MRFGTTILYATSLMVFGLSSTVAQETREKAVAGMRHVDPKEMDPTYTKPAPFAQKLVDEASELFERFNDGLTLGNLRLIECYVDGRLNLLLEARWGTIDFYIVCQRAHDLSAGGNAPVGSHLACRHLQVSGSRPPR